MDIVHTCDAMPPYLRGAFVPTMGALHDGHCALIRRAAELGEPVIVSIFVNPTQFGPDEDFETYPRTFDADVAKAQANGASVIFAPSVDEMYPPGQVIDSPPLPTVATGPALEDAHRPDHFKGVCQIVSRLLDIVQPRYAVFGEKDYQQLLVVRAMVQQQKPRWNDLKITAHPTLRDSDGLALSSRNACLQPAERERALGLSRSLQDAQSADSPADAERVMYGVLIEHDLSIDYAVVRDGATLLPVDDFSKPCRALIAAKLGSVRLIDNMPVPETE